MGILIASLLFTNCSSDKKKNRNIPVESITEIDSILSPITENFEIQGNQESVIKAFENNEFNSDTIIILLGQSPKHNGMPELHKLTSPINVLQDRGLNIALVTDGRMSGASGSFPALIHAISENLNLYKIQDRDQLTLDLESQTLEVKDLSTLSSRTPHEIKISNEGLGRELFSLFRDNISNAEEGATIFKYS